jgi:ornithine decarboxylase
MTEIRRHTRFRNVREVVRTLQPIDPVYCLRPHTVRERAQAFVSAFPGRTLYAVKCNPHPTVLDALVAGGVEAFDTASLAEIRQIRESWPEAGCYYMNPVRPRAAMTTARTVYGVTHFVVDHPDELNKLAAELGAGPEVTVVVRMTTEKSSETTFHLADKFGAEPGLAIDLLRCASSLGFRAGLAFHVGSQCRDPAAYRKALRRAGDVVARSGVRVACLDLGGGFPAPYDRADVPPLAAFMAEIRAGLDELALPDDCEILAEPGRTLVAEGCSLLVQVHLRKGRRLYINDGVFGSFGEVQAAGLSMPGEVIRLTGPVSGETVSFDLAGPTCDSLDIIPAAASLPDDVDEGDWIAFHCMGAYSNALVTRFNGFCPDTFVEVSDDPTRTD